MAVSERIRTRLRAAVPTTSGRLTESGFLLAGATAGLLGWGGTQLLAWFDPPGAALLATALWGTLIAAFLAVTILHAPEAIRFSDAMFVWGSVNGTATTLTVAGLAGHLPADVTVWHVWVIASALGYVGTGGLLLRAGATDRGRGYLASGVVAVGVLAVGSVAFPDIEPVAFLALAALHAVALGLDTVTALSAVSRGTVLAGTVSAILAAGLV